MEHKFLLGLTTTPRSNWRQKIKDIDRLNLKSIALFPTFLKPEERQDLYRLLEKTGLREAPHVHLRDDFTTEEIVYLKNTYNSRLFNIHTDPQYDHLLNNDELKNCLYVENLSKIDLNFRAMLAKSSGICFDIAHYEDNFVKQGEDSYRDFKELMRKNSVGCCHISVIKEAVEYYTHYRTALAYPAYSNHWLSELGELDYVKKYSEFLPEYISLELENDFSVQFNAIDYLKKLIT